MQFSPKVPLHVAFMTHIYHLALVKANPCTKWLSTWYIRGSFDSLWETSRDQQYMFGVRSLLTAEKALLIRNDLAGMLLRRPMPWLTQLMLSYGPTAACQFQTLFGTPVFHDIQCTESSAIISSFGRCLLDIVASMPLLPPILSAETVTLPSEFWTG